MKTDYRSFRGDFLILVPMLMVTFSLSGWAQGVSGSFESGRSTDSFERSPFEVAVASHGVAPQKSGDQKRKKKKKKPARKSKSGTAKKQGDRPGTEKAKSGTSKNQGELPSTSGPAAEPVQPVESSLPVEPSLPVDPSQPPSPAVEKLASVLTRGNASPELRSWFIAGLVHRGHLELLSEVTPKFDALMEPAAENPYQADAAKLVARKLALQGNFEEARKWAEKIDSQQIRFTTTAEVGRIQGFRGDVDAALRTIQSAAKIFPEGDFMLGSPIQDLAIELHQAGRKQASRKVASKLPKGVAEFFPMILRSEGTRFDINRIDDCFVHQIVASSLLRAQKRQTWLTKRLACLGLAARKSDRFKAELEKSKGEQPTPESVAKLFHGVAKSLEIIALHIAGDESAKGLAVELDEQLPADEPSKSSESLLTVERNLESYAQIVTGSWDEKRIRSAVSKSRRNPSKLLIGIGVGLRRTNQGELLEELIRKSKGETKSWLTIGGMF